MRNRVYFLSLLVCVLQVLSCKKEQQQHSPISSPSYSNSNLITSFAVNGEFVPTAIDTVGKSITVTMPVGADMSHLTINFKLSGQLGATLNNNTVQSGATVDLSKLSTLTIASADNKFSVAFQVYAETELQYIGLLQYGGSIVAQKSMNKAYNYYFDQFDGSQYQSINCGPTVSTMALRWADSTFGGTPVSARNQIPENGNWWFTSDIITYLADDGVNTSIDSLSDIPTVVKRAIDNGDLLILCLDMYYMPGDYLYSHHVQKFYQTYNPGWGHFLLVKGYRQTDDNFYLEIYDPYSDHNDYLSPFASQLKGQDRYYSSSGLTVATAQWWPYTIVVAPKGQQVTATSRLSVNSLQKIPVARGQ